MHERSSRQEIFPRAVCAICPKALRPRSLEPCTATTQLVSLSMTPRHPPSLRQLAHVQPSARAKANRLLTKQHPAFDTRHRVKVEKGLSLGGTSKTCNQMSPPHALHTQRDTVHCLTNGLATCNRSPAPALRRSRYFPPPPLQQLLSASVALRASTTGMHSVSSLSPPPLVPGHG